MAAKIACGIRTVSKGGLVARHCRVSMALKSSPEPVDLFLLRACVPAIGLLLISRLHFRMLIWA